MSRKKRRDLSPQEKALWDQVAGSVKPIAKNAVMPPTTEPLPLPSNRVLRPKIKPVVEPPAKILPGLSPLGAGDPRRARQVARGRLAIDAVIDLHGMRQDEADRATAGFIARSAAQGHRVLLIITGKGSRESEHGRGVLRKRFLHGIETGLYGTAITSVRQAHQRHGGSGAFYVFLKARGGGPRLRS